MFSVSDAVYRKVTRAQRGQEMCENEDNIFNSNEVRLFRPARELPLDFPRGDRHASFRLQPPRQLHRETRLPPPFARACRVGGGDHANVVVTDPTVIDALGSIDPLFNMVKPIRIGYERSPDSSQNASHACIRTKHSERPEANLASSG